MADLKQKIYENIVEQLTLKLKSERLQQELQANERRGNTIIGRMSVLAELYEEQNGRSLDHDLNKNEEWSDLIKQAQMQAEKIVAEQAIAGTQSEQKNSSVPQRPVKAVAGNKQPISVPQPTQVLTPSVQSAQVPQPVQNEADAVPSVARVVVADSSADAPKQQERTPISDRKEPIKFTIDDAPPAPPPGTPVTDLDDD